MLAVGRVPRLYRPEGTPRFPEHLRRACRARKPEALPERLRRACRVWLPAHPLDAAGNSDSLLAGATTCAEGFPGGVSSKDPAQRYWSCRFAPRSGKVCHHH